MQFQCNQVSKYFPALHAYIFASFCTRLSVTAALVTVEAGEISEVSEAYGAFVLETSSAGGGSASMPAGSFVRGKRIAIGKNSTT